MSIVGKRIGNLVALRPLLEQCLAAERDLNKRIYVKLWEEFPTLFNPTDFKLEHGYYIKYLLRGDYYEKKADNSWHVDKILDEISQDPEELIELGIAAVYTELLNNKALYKKEGKNKYKAYAWGNYDEIQSFYNFKHMLETKFAGSGATIKDTSPKHFEDSVHYDMQITFPQSKIRNKGIDQIIPGFSINIENKTGVTTDALSSKFHFGTVSSSAIVGGTFAYQDFLKLIQDISYRYLTGATYGDAIKEIRRAKYTFMKDIAIQYIQWKLDNYWPVFVSSGKNGIVLCSEIVQAMIKHDMLSFDGGTEDPGDQLLEVYRAHNYRVEEVIYDPEAKTYHSQTQHHYDPWGYMSYGSSPVNLRKDAIRGNAKEGAIEKAIKKVMNKNKIMPDFKLSLWYGAK